MKKLIYFILATIVLSFGLSKITIAGNYGSSVVVVGSTPVSGGSNGDCLTISSGSISSAGCAAGSANTALSNLATTAVNQNLLPGTTANFNLGSGAKAWYGEYVSILVLQDPTSGGHIQFSFPVTANTYSVIYPSTQGSANSALSNDGSGNLSWATTYQVYDTSGSIQTAPHAVFATTTLVNGSSPVTLSGSSVFSSASSYGCSGSDSTAFLAVGFSYTSGTSFTVKGTTTDVIRFQCVGN